MAVAAVIMAVMAAVIGHISAFRQRSALNKQAGLLESAADENIKALGDQQSAVVDEAQSEKGDRARQADAELASLIVAFGEVGGLGTINLSRAATELGFIEGIDLSRIDRNRDAFVDNIQARKRNIALNTQAKVIGLKAQGEALVLGSFSSVLQIGASAAASGGGGGK